MSENKPETPTPHLYCGNCGAPIPPKKHFCEVCLAPASIATTTPPSPPEPAPPQPVEAAPLQEAAAYKVLPTTAPATTAATAPPSTGAVPTLPQGPPAVPPGAPIPPLPGSAVPAAPGGPQAPLPAPAVIPVPPGKVPPVPSPTPAAQPPLVPYVPVPTPPAAAPGSGSNTWWIVLCVVAAVLAVLPLLVGCLTLLIADDMAARGTNTAVENRLISLFCCILPGLVLTAVAVFAGRRAARKPR